MQWQSLPVLPWQIEAWSNGVLEFQGYREAYRISHSVEKEINDVCCNQHSLILF
jgi:hypothetical protein